MPGELGLNCFDSLKIYLHLSTRKMQYKLLKVLCFYFNKPTIKDHVFNFII